jgi:hypothetical protein
LQVKVRPPFKDWHAEHSNIGLCTYAEASAFGEVIVNATSGGVVDESPLSTDRRGR